jgi:hypothetical protein
MKLTTITATNAADLTVKLSSFYDSGVNEVIHIEIFNRDGDIELIITYR